jgi:uncharacterized protein
MIARQLEAKLKKLATQFPAVAVLGPRQSGKTTLAKATFPDYRYFSFEDVAFQLTVREDPKAFLARYRNEPGIILDEIQHVPELFSYMQLEIDDYKKKGHFIVTGSQNFALNQAITQSLAGRIALLTLLPLSIAELKTAHCLPSTVDEVLLKGMYPAMYADAPEAVDWYRSYINTYIERDVRQIRNVTDLTAFQKFMRLCASRVGQILSLTSLSNASGLSVSTIKQWLSVLQASYSIFLLPPYYGHISGRLVKSPKLYFYDTGVICGLLSITSVELLFDHYLRGNIFESFIIADLIKQRENQGLNPNVFFWRDKNDYEIDCIIEEGQRLIPLEIKVSQTFNQHYFDGFARFNQLTETDPAHNIVVYTGDLTLATKRGKMVSWQEVGTGFKEL